MAIHENILELEIGGELVEVIKYWGELHRKQMIVEYKTVYNLCEDDDYQFFIYRSSSMKTDFNDNLADQIEDWETLHGNI